ncbi:hypothetical protein [Streptomyces aidingensis]|uniref:Uncharacterized protein n=1 Tax=Streptomyces aidingensis TaxID=910347 RepID=A0A1I1LEP1_9ACTN|nr:hypothetical protein [Streptomyces aidingensis]SFC71465.1 hypothetical protein SAMN05421773_105186 [Streptomyces aidingensis]
MEWEFSYSRVIKASMVVLVFATALVGVVGTAYGLAREPLGAVPPSPVAVLIVGFPVLAAWYAVCMLIVSHLLVLPTVWLTGVLERRSGGRGRWWWSPLVAAAVSLALVAAGVATSPDPVRLPSVTWLWLLLTAVLTGPALLCRWWDPHRLTRAARWGTGLVAGSALLAGLAYGTGLLELYRPPTVTPEMLAGTWSDGSGGTLRLAADGGATASGLDEHDFDEAVGECGGQGTWRIRQCRGSSEQSVDVSISGCSGESWSVGGTEGRVTLYRLIGDPDLWDVYELRKSGDGG